MTFLFSSLSMGITMSNEVIASAETEKETDQELEYSDIIPNDVSSVELTEEDFYVNQAISEILASEDEQVCLNLPSVETLNVISTAQDIVNSIISDEAFNINGTINVSSDIVNITDYYDFSNISKYSIASWAYELNLISEKEKIESYCDLILQRNFSNTSCIEGVFDELQNYYSIADADVAEKIETILAVPFDNDTGISTMSISSESTYTSTNFTIHYDNTKTTSTVAANVANYFETVRTQYINMGFNTPKLQWFKSTYQVYLDPDVDPNGTALATTVKSATLTNTCASYIKLYNFTTLNDAMRENIAHEYFHAIQNAYNHQSGWFKEACANWGSIAIGSTYNITLGWIRNFITSSTNVSMPTLSGYGAVLFPLTIHYSYGGTSAIRSIYEAYNSYSASASLDTLRTAITNGIVNNGYSNENFNVAYRRMVSFLVHPTIWYNTVADTSSTTFWPNVAMNSTWTASTSGSVYTGSLNYLSSNYYRITVPSNYTGNVKINITFSSGLGALQSYTVDKYNRHVVSYYLTTSSGVCYLEKSDVGDDINELTLVLSNLESSDSITFTATITLYDYGNTISFTSVSRYLERLCYIPCGEYEEYTVTFATAGSKTIQTFGEYDTKLELYSASGTLLASNDDSGYSLNALIRYYTSANTTYVIRVKFYSSSKFGETQLAITPAYGALSSDVTILSSYEDIYSINTTTYTWTSFAEQNYTRMVRFIPSSNGTYTFELSSTFDNYIYVIDPRYARVQVVNVDYNDDGGSGLNAKLSKYLFSGVPYLVIYSAYNPGNANTTGELILTISK